MEHKTGNNTSYGDLKELARSRNITVIESDALEDRHGFRFNKSGTEYIVLNPNLSANEKIRTLGFLLENQAESIATQPSEMGKASSGEELDYLFSLNCPRS